MKINVPLRWESEVIEAIQPGDNRVYDDKGGLVQVPGVGIMRVKVTFSDKTREKTWKFKKITNFIISDLELTENDEGNQVVKFNGENERGKVEAVKGNINMFNSPKSFRNALNSMHLIFWGSTGDLQELKMYLLETLK